MPSLRETCYCCVQRVGVPSSRMFAATRRLTNCDEKVGERHARAALYQEAGNVDQVLLSASCCVTSRSGATSIASDWAYTFGNISPALRCYPLGGSHDASDVQRCWCGTVIAAETIAGCKSQIATCSGRSSQCNSRSAQVVHPVSVLPTDNASGCSVPDSHMVYGVRSEIPKMSQPSCRRPRRRQRAWSQLRLVSHSAY